jgi:AcrR family transcriptional regulator
MEDTPRTAAAHKNPESVPNSSQAVVNSESGLKLKSVTPSEDKQKKLERVAKSVLSIVARFGFESLSPSRLARAAQVSRPWVYKYVGGSKEALSNFAVDHFGKLLARLDEGPKPTSIDFFRDDEILRLQNAIAFSEQHPEVIQIYYRYKGTPTIMGKAIEKVEAQYRKIKSHQIKETFKIKDVEAEIYAEILLTLKLGLCHKWISGELKTKIKREEYLRVTGDTFRRFFANTK